jgi:hypothetical protein
MSSLRQITARVWPLFVRHVVTSLVGAIRVGGAAADGAVAELVNLLGTAAVGADVRRHWAYLFGHSQQTHESNYDGTANSSAPALMTHMVTEEPRLVLCRLWHRFLGIGNDGTEVSSAPFVCAADGLGGCLQRVRVPKVSAS